MPNGIKDLCIGITVIDGAVKFCSSEVDKDTELSKCYDEMKTL